MDTHSYLTDLSDAEWRVVQPLLPPEKRRTGRSRQHPLRTIVNAIVYVLRAGCAWRLLLPHEWPAWQTVYQYFRTWRLDGTWEQVHGILRQQEGTRRRMTRHACYRPAFVKYRPNSHGGSN